MSTIERFARDAADELRAKYGENVEGEFVAWCHIALRREALVSEAYDKKHISLHLSRLMARGVSLEVITEIRLALSSAWAQEEAHQRYLRFVVAVVLPDAELQGQFNDRIEQIRGFIEGRALAGLVAPSFTKRVRAQIAIAVGRMIFEVPEFVTEISAMPFEQFCELNADLEATAVTGYERMLDLLGALGKRRRLRASTLRFDLFKMLLDERYHHRLFTELAELIGPVGYGPDGVSIGPRGRSPVLSGIEGKEEANEAVLRAQRHAYGDDNLWEARATVEVNEQAIAEDPLVALLRRSLTGTEIPTELTRPRRRPPSVDDEAGINTKFLSEFRRHRFRTEFGTPE